MPSTSEKQASFMNLCYHNRSAARGKCPPPKVVREYLRRSRKGRSLGKARLRRNRRS